MVVQVEPDRSASRHVAGAWMNWRILHGDVREQLASLPDGCVQTCVTSPPYFGLRDYGHAGQIGLEPTPEAFVAALVAVFADVRRVLADDGTLWLNLGDSYATQGGRGEARMVELGRPSTGALTPHEARGSASGTKVPDGLKAKDLIGIPWRVAFALQADGWYLRSDIIWSKPNPMPESVTDRPTKAHEYIFLLSKSQRYYYDAEAIAESDARSYDARTWDQRKALGQTSGNREATRMTLTAHVGHDLGGHTGTRNKRSVWHVATQPYSGAHFATFPEALIEPCILAGSRPAGKRCDCDEVISTPTGSGPIEDPTLVVGRAGFNRPRRADEGTRPITRREQRGYAEQMRVSPFRAEMAESAGDAFAHYIRTDASGARPLPPSLLTAWLAIGWLRDPEPCDCPVMPADTVLDPFTGSGTTGAVAIRHQRNFIGCELNADYIALAEKRIGAVAPLFSGGEVQGATPLTAATPNGQQQSIF
jgi:DNA modification methylase